LRRHGIRSAIDIAYLNPKTLFTRNVKLVDFAFELHGRKVLLSTTNSYRERAREHQARSDRLAYRVNVRGRAWGLVHRLSLHRIQGFKSLYPSRAARLKSLSPDLLCLPENVLLLDGARRNQGDAAAPMTPADDNITCHVVG
jgi:hypothetical protein